MSKAGDFFRFLASLKREQRLYVVVFGHYFQVIRGDPMDPELKKVPAEELRKLYGEIARIQEAYAARAFQDDDSRARWIKRMIYVGTFDFHTHICFLHDSLRFSLKAQIVGVPKSHFMRHAW